MKDVFPMSTQEDMLLEVELQSKNQKNTKRLQLKIKKLNKSMVKVLARRKATCSKILHRNNLYDFNKLLRRL